MRMRQVVGGVWGVLIQVVGVGKWAFLAISGLGELEKLKHCQKGAKRCHNLTNLTKAPSTTIRVSNATRKPPPYANGNAKSANSACPDAPFVIVLAANRRRVRPRPRDNGQGSLSHLTSVRPWRHAWW